MTTQNFGPGIVGGVVLVDPGTGLPYRASAGEGGGADGASAYEVAVSNGFVGTEAAWLASLQGTPGADGAPAAPGSIFVVRWITDHWEDAEGTTITERPSDRTDLTMMAFTTGSTPPAFALAGIDVLCRIGV